MVEQSIFFCNFREFKVVGRSEFEITLEIFRRKTYNEVLVFIIIFVFVIDIAIVLMKAIRLSILVGFLEIVHYVSL